MAAIARWRIEENPPGLLSRLEFGAAFERGLRRSLFIIQRRAVLNLSGRFLKVRTGRGRSSVQTRVEGQGSRMRGFVGSNVFYLAVHHGGKIIVPKTKKYLHFKVNGRWVMTKRVVLPPRPWLWTAFAESREDIRRAFDEEVAAAIRQAIVARTTQPPTGGARA